jgi:hypothetical protein
MEPFRPSTKQVILLTGKTPLNVEVNLPILYKAMDDAKSVNRWQSISATIAILATVATEGPFAPISEQRSAYSCQYLYWQGLKARVSLGNRCPEDAYKYRGRGYVQLTGYGNYLKYGKIIGVDLAGNPEKANEPETASHILLAYAADHGLDVHAARGNWHRVRELVNGPDLNGWDYFAGQHGLVWKFMDLAYS